MYIFWILSSRGTFWYQRLEDWLSFHWFIRGWHVGWHRSRSAPTCQRLQFRYKNWIFSAHRRSSRLPFVMKIPMDVTHLVSKFGWNRSSSFGDINFFVICVLGGHVGGQCYGSWSMKGASSSNVQITASSMELFFGRSSNATLVQQAPRAASHAAQQYAKTFKPSHVSWKNVGLSRQLCY